MLCAAVAPSTTAQRQSLARRYAVLARRFAVLASLLPSLVFRATRTHPGRIPPPPPRPASFNANHTVSLATSADLVNWSLVGVVLAVAARPPGILFSPWVARSVETGLYVLWFNVLPIENGAGVFDAAFYAIATSADPAGPFVTVNSNVTGIAYTRLPDAPAVFVDDDGSAYVAFTHEDSHVNNVQELSRDLLGPLPGGRVSPQIGASNNEGVLMFKRADASGTPYVRCSALRGGGASVRAGWGVAASLRVPARGWLLLTRGVLVAAPSCKLMAAPLRQRGGASLPCSMHTPTLTLCLPLPPTTPVLRGLWQRALRGEGGRGARGGCAFAARVEGARLPRAWRMRAHHPGL